MSDPYIVLISEEGFHYFQFSEAYEAYLDTTQKSEDQALEHLLRAETFNEAGINWIAEEACIFLGEMMLVPLYLYRDAMIEVGDSEVKSIHLRESTVDSLID